jgi:hypothetical protein
MQKREYFQKRTDFVLGLPKNYDDLRKEVQHWPRIGNPVVKTDCKLGAIAENELAVKVKDANLDKQGFVKISDYDYVYPEFANDIERMIIEGHLIEFRDYEVGVLHKDIRQEHKERKRGQVEVNPESNNEAQRATAHNRSVNEKRKTLLYPVHVKPTIVHNDGAVEKEDVEVRGTDADKYPNESLNLLSCLYNKQD